jgi:hypothetical protein
MALALSDASFYAGGYFTTVAGESRCGLAAFGPAATDVAITVPFRGGELLVRNDPNPFHASTVFRFTLPSPQQVTLRVYDVTGRLVTTLLQGEQRDAGPQQARMQAGALPAGVYFYRLQAGSERVEGKMLLVR